MISEQTPIAFADELPSEAEVVIIGGGIIGTSTAYFLAKAGVKVVLCEKGRIAGEQSSRNWGWCRQMGRDVREIPLILESMRLWRNMGIFRPNGNTICQNINDWGCSYCGQYNC